MTTKQLICEILSSALDKIGVQLSEIPIEYPEDHTFGHYSSPISMRLAKTLKKNPQDIAKNLKSYLLDHPMFSRVEIAGPGYLNFFLSDEYLTEKLAQITDEDKFGKNTALADQSILLEYVSANPTGPLHIGHGRWAAVGDSLARVLSFCGAKVFREFYVNDAGVQIQYLRDTVSAIQDSRSIPEDGYRGDYVKELADTVLKEKKDPEVIMQAWQKITLDNFRVHFDQWFSEKSLHQNDSISQLLKELEEKDIVYKKDGALWFRSSSYGSDEKDRVVVKSDGAYSYLASDIAYHQNKIQRGYRTLINILGADHHGYVQRISAAVSVLGGHLTVLLGQMVNLFRNGEAVRMSKRTGDIISLDEVIEEIGVDVTRYLLLRRPMDSPVDFDLESAKISSDNNPVFYVQYAHARANSVLKNTKIQEFKAFVDDHERRLLVEMIKFEDLILDFAYSYEIHKIPIYLENLSSLFHRFYKNCRIINHPNEGSRLVLCAAFKKLLKEGLSLLGIEALDKMRPHNPQNIT